MNFGVDTSEAGADWVGSAPALRFRLALDAAVAKLASCEDLDWSVPAGTLEWSCAQTAGHVVDCVFSYSFQLASRTTNGLLPFGELRPLPEALPKDLVTGLSAVGELFVSLLQSVPSNTEASDGVTLLGLDDWAARGAYEVLLHSHDILQGLAVEFDPPLGVCAWVAASPNLWMLNRDLVREAAGDAWKGLLLGSGR